MGVSFSMLNQVANFIRQDYMLLTVMVGLPIISAILLWFLRKHPLLKSIVAITTASINMFSAVSLLSIQEFFTTLPFAPYGFDLSFRVYGFSALFLMITGVMFFLIVLFTLSNLKKADFGGIYFLYLYLSLGLINGAMLSNHLGLMLFFWEGLLCTLFGMLLIRQQEHPETAVKALTISGTADLLLMLGIIITTYLAGSGKMTDIHSIPIQGMGIIGFFSLVFGALGKAGSMPFHSWIPNASKDAPTAFMVAFPASLEKILGIYFTARIILDVYDYIPGSAISLIMMSVATVTIVFAVAMALIQKDMKKLLSYHAISQLGYMLLGIASGHPIGMMGGLFHLLNNALYKTGLFMIAGSIEDQTGTTDLHHLGGLRKNMPITAICFLVFAFSIAGFPGTNGFFSKELVFDAALEIHPVFYFGALLGAFMTALSFLKIGRSLFFGPLTLPQNQTEIKETSWGMLLPIVALAAMCLLFGISNNLPLDHMLGEVLHYEEHFSGWPHSWLLVLISAAVLLLALLDHAYGSKKTGHALSAADHIHYAPGLKQIYHWAEKGYFDPYQWLMVMSRVFSWICVQIEKIVSWLYDSAIPGLFLSTGNALHRFDNGSLPRYLSLAIAGLVLTTIIFLTAMPF